MGFWCSNVSPGAKEKMRGSREEHVTLLLFNPLCPPPLQKSSKIRNYLNKNQNFV
jgi:hypothetical protein